MGTRRTTDKRATDISSRSVSTSSSDRRDFDDTEFMMDEDGNLGEILSGMKKLTAEQRDAVARQQDKSGQRFGDAAIALGLATPEDVVSALSQQYNYHYSRRSDLVTQSELVLARQPFSADVEVFRDLRTQLLLDVMSPKNEFRALAVVSANKGDGKTFIAANLAVSFSQLSGRTLLIDADMRSPRQHKLFGLDNTSGLSAILAGRIEADVIRPVSHLPNLHLLPVGAVPPNPLELIQHPAFAALVREMARKFDHVIVDTPAAIHGSDARVIASCCAAALLIGRRGATHASDVQKLASQLAGGPSKLAGVVMNDF